MFNPQSNILPSQIRKQLFWAESLLAGNKNKDAVYRTPDHNVSSVQRTALFSAPNISGCEIVCESNTLTENCPENTTKPKFSLGLEGRNIASSSAAIESHQPIFQTPLSPECMVGHSKDSCTSAANAVSAAGDSCDASLSSLSTSSSCTLVCEVVNLEEHRVCVTENVSTSSEGNIHPAISGEAGPVNLNIAVDSAPLSCRSPEIIPSRSNTSVTASVCQERTHSSKKKRTWQKYKEKRKRRKLAAKGMSTEQCDDFDMILDDVPSLARDAAVLQRPSTEYLGVDDVAFRNNALENGVSVPVSDSVAASDVEVRNDGERSVAVVCSGLDGDLFCDASIVHRNISAVGDPSGLRYGQDVTTCPRLSKKDENNQDQHFADNGMDYLNLNRRECQMTSTNLRDSILMIGSPKLNKQVLLTEDNLSAAVSEHLHNAHDGDTGQLQDNQSRHLETSVFFSVDGCLSAAQKQGESVSQPSMDVSSEWNISKPSSLLSHSSSSSYVSAVSSVDAGIISSSNSLPSIIKQSPSPIQTHKVSHPKETLRVGMESGVNRRKRNKRPLDVTPTSETNKLAVVSSENMELPKNIISVSSNNSGSSNGESFSGSPTYHTGKSLVDHELPLQKRVYFQGASSHCDYARSCSSSVVSKKSVPSSVKSPRVNRTKKSGSISCSSPVSSFETAPSSKMLINFKQEICLQNSVSSTKNGRKNVGNSNGGQPHKERVGLSNKISVRNGNLRISSDGGSEACVEVECSTGRYSTKMFSQNIDEKTVPCQFVSKDMLSDVEERQRKSDTKKQDAFSLNNNGVSDSANLPGDSDDSDDMFNNVLQFAKINNSLL